MKVELRDLVPIGRFSRLSGLTVKALRHYDDIGLLEPARVDPSTGYRFYSIAQVRAAEAIKRLRRLEVPLDEIATLLRSPDGVVRERLAVHRAHLEGRAVETQRILSELDDLIDGKEPLVRETEEKEIRLRFRMAVEEAPQMQVLVLRERVGQDTMTETVERAIREVRQYLDELGIGSLGPPFCICPFADEEGMVAHEAGWPVSDGTPGRGRIEAKTLPASRALVLDHQGPYDELSRSYRLMAEAMERHGLTPAGDPIEVYLSDPDEVADPNDHETRIVWPIGPEGRLELEGDVFRRRAELD